MTFPENDNEFVEEKITGVEKQSDGTYAIACDGWHLWCGKDCPIVPQVGQTVRKYGKGIGARVRGLFIDGVKVWYRSQTEDDEHNEIESYGKDVTDWLARWDEGRSVWSIEMGGIGPGYEQAIQVTMAEILRHMVAAKFDADAWIDSEVWKRDLKAIETFAHAHERIKALGLSGAQWGAAVNLACQFFKNGPRGVMADPEVKDRHIQVSDNFPAKAA